MSKRGREGSCSQPSGSGSQPRREGSCSQPSAAEVLDVKEEVDPEETEEDFEDCESSVDPDDSVFTFEYTWSCGGNDDPMSFPHVPWFQSAKRRRIIDERARTMDRFRAMPPEAWRPLNTTTFLGASRYMRLLSSGRLGMKHPWEVWRVGPVIFDKTIGPPGRYCFLGDDVQPGPWTNAKVCHAIFGLGKTEKGPPYVCVRNIIPSTCMEQ